MTENTAEGTVSAVVPTNQEVADKIGLSHSGVSRIRSGQRLPSFDAMRRIEAVYNWPLSAQATAREKGTYAQEFETAISQPSDGLTA